MSERIFLAVDSRKNRARWLVSPHDSFIPFSIVPFLFTLYCCNNRTQFSASVLLIDTERVKEIAFNDERTEQFALTTDRNVVFLTRVGDNFLNLVLSRYFISRVFRKDIRLCTILYFFSKFHKTPGRSHFDLRLSQSCEEI